MQWLDNHVSFDPPEDFSEFLGRVPARGAVYLLSDAEDKPFQLLSVKNLRASLSNRLCEHPADEKTRSIPYRQVVRKVSYRRVDSTAEGEWVYAQCAAELFPATYRKMIDSWSAWYVSIDPEAKFPRYLVTDRPAWELSRTTFGPIPTKAAAQKMVATLEDAFDLCRYHHILIQAPHGQACAYKQMHKCPAPCDGSISLGMYHHQIEQSINAIGNAKVIAEHEERMRQAAGALRYEVAGRVKAYVEQLKSLTGGQLEHARSISAMRLVAVLRGSKAKSWKLMLLMPEEIAMTGEWSDVKEVAGTLQEYGGKCDCPRPWEDLDRLAFVARQIMLKSGDCVFVSPTVDAVTAAAASLRRRKAEAASAEEGVVQES